MKTRLIIFAKVKTQSGAELCYFAVPKEGFLQDLGEQTLVEFANVNELVRHDSFDWTVGDAGASCALFESKTSQTLLLTNPLDALPQSWAVANTRMGVEWLLLPTASKTLRDGSDKRFLQLAVQFVAAGSKVEDVVVAAPNDPELMKMIEEETNKDPHLLQ